MAAIACEGRIWYKNTTQKPCAPQGGAHSRAHDRRQPEKAPWSAATVPVHARRSERGGGKRRL